MMKCLYLTVRKRAEAIAQLFVSEIANDCPAKPVTAFPYMAHLARKYMLDDYGFEYEKSLFSMKPVLMSSEIDDSRPTVIRKYSERPTFVSVLSGKINTVYDLDEVLSDDEIKRRVLPLL